MYKRQVEEIRRISGRLIAEGIERLRLGKVRWNPGFDGEYGKVQIFDEEERGEIAGPVSYTHLFNNNEKRNSRGIFCYLANSQIILRMISEAFSLD